jgi:hypothetical protein
METSIERFVGFENGPQVRNRLSFLLLASAILTSCTEHVGMGYPESVSERETNMAQRAVVVERITWNGTNLL